MGDRYDTGQAPTKGSASMGKSFKGKISLDIRDSEGDWAPFLPPQAPEGA
jgi:hypothetical protein